MLSVLLGWTSGLWFFPFSVAPTMAVKNYAWHRHAYTQTHTHTRRQRLAHTHTYLIHAVRAGWYLHKCTDRFVAYVFVFVAFFFWLVDSV